MRVLEALLGAPEQRHWGYQLQKRAGVRSGVLYPILRRLHEEGWVTDGWEEPSEVPSGRPPRRYYVLTPAGSTAARQMLAEAVHDPRFAWLMPGVTA